MVFTRHIFWSFVLCLLVPVVFAAFTKRKEVTSSENKEEKEAKNELKTSNEGESSTKKSKIDPATLFQQRRALLHDKFLKRTDAKRELYGGKHLKIDFKMTIEHILAITKEDDPKEKEHREKIARELLDTERSYVGHLNVLIEMLLVQEKGLQRSNKVFERPIRESKILTSEQLSHLFSNVDIIRNLNSVLLKDLEQSVGNWNANAVLGTVFMQMADFLKLYIEYINNYTTAIETLDSCTKKSSAFASLVIRCQSDPRCAPLNLPSLLIMPVQRIPRYILLLAEIQKHTPKTNPNFEKLSKSIAKVKAVADEINEARREAEALTRIYELSCKIDHIGEMEFIIPSRKLEMEGEVKERQKGQPISAAKPRYYFLFNDLLLCTKQKGDRFNLQWHILLADLKLLVAEIEDGFGMVAGEQVLYVTGIAPHDTTKWAKSIQTSQQNLTKVIHSEEDILALHKSV